jgi:hypothetical protein
MPLRPSHLLLCSLVRSYTAKSICLNEPVQGSNMNRRSISGLEPEMPVTTRLYYRTFTCSQLTTDMPRTTPRLCNCRVRTFNLVKMPMKYITTVQRFYQFLECDFQTSSSDDSSVFVALTLEYWGKNSKTAANITLHSNVICAYVAGIRRSTKE